MAEFMKKMWESNEVEFLKENYGKMSHAELAKEISALNGRKISRSAISGKVDRLKLTGYGCGRLVLRKVKVAKIPEKATRYSVARISQTPPKARIKPAPSFAANERKTRERFHAVPCEDNVALLDTNSQQCRWPVSDEGTPRMICCGRMIHKGSYCEFHHWYSKRRSEGLPDRAVDARGNLRQWR